MRRSASVADRHRRIRLPACAPSGRPGPPAPPRPACPPAGGAPGAPAAAGGAPWPRRPRSGPASRPARCRPPPAQSPRGRIAPAAHPGQHGQHERQEREGEHPVGPVERGQGVAGGSTLPLQSGKPRQRSPAWKLATWAPNRITTKPRPAVASTRPCERRAAPRAGAACSARGLTGPQRHHQQRRQQEHRVGQVGDDTHGGSASLTVTAPSSTWTTRRTSGQRWPGSGARARRGAGARPRRPRRGPAGSPARPPSGGRSRSGWGGRAGGTTPRRSGASGRRSPCRSR